MSGGPPCQGFSTIGKRRPEDTRSDLLEEFFRVVTILQPEFFIMENVPGLLSGTNIERLRSGLERTEGMYTATNPLVLDSSRFYAATRRRRVYVLGLKGQRRDSIREMEEELNQYESPRGRPTVKDAIQDLQAASYIHEDREGFDIWKLGNKEGMSEYGKK